MGVSPMALPVNMEEDASSGEQVGEQVEGPVEGPVTITSIEKQVLVACTQAPLSAKEISGRLGLSGKPGYIKRILANLRERRCLEFTLSERPLSRLQKYRMTDEGLRILRYEPVKGPVEGPVEGPVTLTSIEKQVLVLCSQAPLSAKEISGRLGLAGKPGYIKRILANLRERRCLEFTLSEKPLSRLQKYRMTDRGRKTLAKGL